MTSGVGRRRAESGEPLPRRQDLPANAFVDVAELRRVHAALPAHIAAAVLPIAAVSYCWLAPEHPDAAGEQLRHVVDTLEKHAAGRFQHKGTGGQIYQPGWREFFPDMGVFWDWGSIYQKDPVLFDASETPEAKPEAERPAFLAALAEKRAFYGGAQYEESRTEEQKAAFRRALEDLGFELSSSELTAVMERFDANGDGQLTKEEGVAVLTRKAGEDTATLWESTGEGTYLLDETIDTNGLAITIQGAVDKDGTPLSILDGQNSLRVMQCLNGENECTVFKDLVIQNGFTEEGGGGLYLLVAPFDLISGPTITNCWFRNNNRCNRG